MGFDGHWAQGHAVTAAGHASGSREPSAKTSIAAARPWRRLPPVCTASIHDHGALRRIEQGLQRFWRTPLYQVDAPQWRASNPRSLPSPPSARRLGRSVPATPKRLNEADGCLELSGANV